MRRPRKSALISHSKSGRDGAPEALTERSDTAPKYDENSFFFFSFFLFWGFVAMKAKRTEARDYTTGRAASELRVSPSLIRSLCQAGMIAARATPGNHFRIPKSEIERLRREGVPEPPSSTPTGSQP